MRLAVIDYDLCNPAKTNYACKRFCPVNRKGEECIRIEEKLVNGVKKQLPVIDEKLCIGCGICIKKCSQKAISIVNTPEALEETPIHRFGQNGFVLFRLPIPVMGVVGLLGPNGIGKTTALRILSGEIKPNLGCFDRDVEWKDIITMHRGNELQTYLEKLSKEEIKTVYKPQQVDKIKKVCKGVVKELLEDVDKSIIDKLELKNCLDRNIADLSGGELQRVAIAKAVSKKADIYYFDEPSSYLDVRQRMNVAKIIRELSQKSPVMVVEHDLATLDFLADRIHIFYGVPSVFGAVSKPYSTLNGVNTFLSGYIREDNIRIREKTVFSSTVSENVIKKPVLTEFTDLKKRFKTFELNIKSDKIYKNEVLGIFGANALGKTTFARILAGEITPDNGELDKKIKISYKPQYISSDFKGKVEEVVQSKQEFKQKYMEPLELTKLLEKNIPDLSGGELQRVAIASCLAKNADVYLLDEPSAYLDVDQRLAVAKILKTRSENSSVLVIDHDLLFLSYLSDRAMVFTGIPGKIGKAECMSVKDGFNTFLKEVGVTFRKDVETNRPRANKLGSQKDTKQKESGEYYLGS
ncbi:MAG: ribosome biogenesis/translation initiation ATPase RLI [Candidatus Aenigmatarchaeota archaeon]|nr:MAG: ribosome biogenesis/translation initiation ATPase RLI [Candidatus Aenigmarchaeota archaeon]